MKKLFAFFRKIYFRELCVCVCKCVHVNVCVRLERRTAQKEPSKSMKNWCHNASLHASLHIYTFYKNSYCKNKTEKEPNVEHSTAVENRPRKQQWIIPLVVSTCLEDFLDFRKSPFLLFPMSISSVSRACCSWKALSISSVGQHGRV